MIGRKNDPVGSEKLPIGDRVKKLRMEKHMTQTELARRLGMTPGAISRFESGETMVGVGTLLEIVTILGVGIEDLIPEYSFKEKYKDVWELLMSVPEDRRSKLLDGLKATLEALTDKET